MLMMMMVMVMVMVVVMMYNANGNAFYFLTALVKTGVIIMEQDKPFGEIRIFRGPNW